jgi:uncharacterized protein YbaP (TraB family)
VASILPGICIAAGTLRSAAILSLALTPLAALAQLPAWHAVHPQQPGTLLLLGSIHLLSASDYPLPGVVERIYAQADNIVFEIDLDDIEPVEIQTQLMSAALLGNGMSLEDVIDAQLYGQTAELAQDLGIDLRLFARFEPWFVATMLMSIGLSNQGYEPQYGIEQFLLAKSLRDGKEVLGVEALESQVSVFDQLSDHDQSAFLEQTVTELRNDATAMQQLVAAWRNGELSELQEELIGDFAQFPGLYEHLVVDRNTAWTTVLEQLSTRNQVSAIIVGALHLVGDDSVIEQLRRRGYEINPIQ